MMAKYTFPLTEEETGETDALCTLFADGKETRVYIQICGGNEYCVSVDNLDDEIRPHVKHVSFARSASEACRLAIGEYECPSVIV